MSGYKASLLRALCLFCLLAGSACASSSSNFLNDTRYDSESYKGAGVSTSADVMAP